LSTQLLNNSTTQQLTHQLIRHITPLSPWRGVGGEALLSSLFVEGLGVRPVIVGVRLFK